MYNFTKRLLDLFVALAGLTLTAPLFLLIAIAIKLDSPGPVFYRGLRIGQHGRPFRIFKFRSMVVNAERLGGPSVADTDPRITRVGKFLRKTKLDELPQLLNVLKGEMSLVGPRPEVPQYVEMFTPEERAILSVKPGMTDWASLWDIDEGAILAKEPDPEKAYQEKIRPEKIRLQLKYVRERSLWTDLKILALTVWSVATKPLKR
ncbi:MAG: sugar transferase [Dehalococcoidia bacterium]|nr:sugar transferase [Dehalococcoidia bacterium]MDW8119905.1 sugar transferase [Chloroflexota bacterium]